MRALLVPAVLLATLVPLGATAQTTVRADTVSVQSGDVTLRGLLFRPPGTGPFPAALYNHGSWRGDDAARAGVLREADVLGRTFVRHGYVLFALFRRGVGLSSDRGASAGELMSRAQTAGGQPERNRVQLTLLQQDEMSDALAGLAFLRAQPDVDHARTIVVGHSFGASLSLLLMQRDTTIRAVIDFAGAANSWSNSPELQQLLLTAVRSTRVPVFVLHAANDYSLAPAKAFAAEHAQKGRPERVQIYPAFGPDKRAGHNFFSHSVATWESDVFSFLAQHNPSAKR